MSSKSIHFRANAADEVALAEIKTVYGVESAAAALRIALQQSRAYRGLIDSMIMWYGTDAFGITPPGAPEQATAFSLFFDLEASAELQEGVNDE